MEGNDTFSCLRIDRMDEVYQGQAVLEKEANIFKEVAEELEEKQGKMLLASEFLFAPSW